jgi:2-keto-4-pentenoate hydratase
MIVDEKDATNLIENKFCAIGSKSIVGLTADGRRLIEKMGLTPKPMKRLKITGSDASDLVDKMFSELE